MRLLSDESLEELVAALRKPEAPCLPSRRSKLSDWWWDWRPRLARYTVTVYGGNEAIMSVHGLSRRDKNVLVKELPGAESWNTITVQVEKFY